MKLLKHTAQWIREMLTTRRQAYQQTFKQGVHSDRVLADLARFCRAGESTFHENPHLSDKLDGRREVWLRIQTHLNLSEEDLWQILGVEE